MLRWKKRIRRMTYTVTDFICIVIASIVANIVYVNVMGQKMSITSLEHIGFLTISTILFMIMFMLLSIYDNTIEEQGNLTPKILIKMFIAYIISSLLLGAGLYYLDVEVSRRFIAIYVIAVMLLQLINKFIMKLTQYNGSGKSEAVRNILVVGQSNRGLNYIDEIEKHNYLNFNLVGYISIKEPNPYARLAYLGTVEELVDIVKDYVIDEIAVARPLSYDSRLEEVLSQCQSMGVTITMLLDVKTEDSTKAHVAMVGNIPVLKFHTVSLNETQLFAKRMLDIIGACAGMILFGLAFVIVGPMIKLESQGPVIFKQNRVGKNGRVFKVWKFRSMGVDAEAKKAALMTNNEMTGHMFKMTNDPRITKVGAFIRKTSIDELPQFWNVLRGDMSLVGTRPPTVNEVKEYEQHHRRRISITPGITGNWQVSGRSDVEDFEEVVRLDSDYIENWSIWSDINILFKTVWVVIAGRGSY